MKITLLLIISTALILIFKSFDKKNKKEKNTNDAKFESTEIKVFSSIKNVSFQYPVFKNWEVKAVEKKNDNECIIWLNWPDEISFEVAPKIIITKMPELGLEYMKEMIRSAILEKSKKGVPLLSKTINVNPYGELYDFVFAPSLYVKNYIPPEGHWDYLQFYNKDFGVRIWIISASKEFGFDKDIFSAKVVKTFNFYHESKKKENDIDGEWKIKSYVFSDPLPLGDSLLFNGKVIFENGKFVITGLYLFQKPGDKSPHPRPIIQSGKYQIEKARIILTNKEYARGGWYFHGDYQVAFFEDYEKIQNQIRNLSKNTDYYFLEKKDKSLFALLWGTIHWEYR